MLREIGLARAILLLALVALGVAVAPSDAPAQQLNLAWVDNSSGQAGFIIERATTGTYSQLVQLPVGTVSYADSSVSLGTTYCYRVAAVNSAGMSAFTNPACASPAGGVTLTIAKTGTGTGTVVSSPAGINCGTTCAYTYTAGKVITLTATAAGGSTFSGWSGGGCSGTGSCTIVGNVPTTVTAPFTLTSVNPVPSLSSISPVSVSLGSLALTLTVSGSGFVPTSTVRWNGSNRTTTFVSASQLTASIPATDLLTAGSASVTVFTPTPGGGTSGAVAFTITASNPAPVLTSLSPSGAVKGGPAFTLTLTGSGFVPTSTVRWNGGNRTTTFVSATQLTASIPASDLAASGTASVTVFNPTPGGGTSSARTFTVTVPTNPTPAITSLSPSSVYRRGPAFTLTVNGTGFVSGATATVDGQSRAVTFVSATQLRIAVLATDIDSSGNFPVRITNPAPCASGACASNTANLNVRRRWN